MTTMASNAFRMLKWLQHSPAKLAQRTARKLDDSAPFPRRSPSDIPLYSLGNRTPSNSSLDSTCRVRPTPTPPRTQSPPPPLPPTNMARPVPSKVHLPVNASWLHDQWASRGKKLDEQQEAQQLNRCVAAAIAEFEHQVATQVPQAPTYPSSAPSRIKVKRPAPLPPVQQAPNPARTKRKAPPPPTTAGTAQPKSAHTSQRPASPPPPPPPPMQLPRQQGSPITVQPRTTSAPQGMNAVFAELLAKVPVTRSHSAPVVSGTSATVTNAVFKMSSMPAKSRVYLKGSDLYPFHEQLQKKLNARPPANEHVPSPEALRQAEAKRAQLALKAASHAYAGKWEPSAADRRLQHELKLVLAARRESTA